mmetsp:Transcript_90598/g.216304  ORF Transcript_90598/g.216304 Transcript_90598/m.216304 type:complete len:286 (+) Transcript_90598:2977-3834(+)
MLCHVLHCVGQSFGPLQAGMLLLVLLQGIRDVLNSECAADCQACAARLKHIQLGDIAKRDHVGSSSVGHLVGRLPDALRCVTDYIHRAWLGLLDFEHLLKRHGRIPSELILAELHRLQDAVHVLVLCSAELVTEIGIVLSTPVSQRFRFWRRIGSEGFRSLHEVPVARAPTDVAIVALHRLFRCGLATSPEKRVSIHDHAWCAKAALHAVILGNSLLHLVQALPLRPNTLNSGDGRSVTGDQGLQTAVHRSISPLRGGHVVLLDSNDTGAAASLETAPLRASQPL